MHMHIFKIKLHSIQKHILSLDKYTTWNQILRNINRTIPFTRVVFLGKKKRFFLTVISLDVGLAKKSHDMIWWDSTIVNNFK